MKKLTYNAPELAILLGISRSSAYNLMHRADFPSFRIGKRLLIKQSKLTEWLDSQDTCQCKFNSHPCNDAILK